MTLEAHDSEVLSLEYSASYIEPPMLATASRDRVLHVLSVDQNYDLVRTLTDHSSSITGVKIHELRNGTIQLVSGGMDKSLVFRNVTIGNGGNVQLTREHIVAEKTTFYDLTLDTEQNLYATACQDRNIRYAKPIDEMVFFVCVNCLSCETWKGKQSFLLKQILE